MSRAVVATTVFLAPLLAAGASAADGERYRLEKSPNGYVRMDTQTGEMSICEDRSGQLVCKLAADERAAFQSDIDRLQARVEALDGRVAKLENSLAARLESTLPTEQEFEKTMGYMERFFRGFIGIVKELEDEQPGKLSVQPNDQKT